MTPSTENHCDIKLPGYTLEKKIGAGGYGEVWLANAPGGLTKAVKFIFGFHNEKRAASELRSLEKIKAVRHPFLLSLERIEVIQGRLVIVTELADGSLKDRFEQSVQAGLPGIAHKELLGYLRDSADALDYLCTQHSLQHLDVKPENLLLLAGHVKVADFGLVKEIQETQASLVGGLTPLYSSPEVFQGQPTRFSDQYSLAVLYQEMLTGTLPFSGTTSAELTLQHMHDEPDLTPLPLAERYVIARALSKNPKQRYDSCHEFVQALLDVDKENISAESWDARPALQLSPASGTHTPELTTHRPGTVTQVFADDLVNEAAQVSDSMMLDLPEKFSGETVDLPSLDLLANEFEPTPTLVIGVGGTAGHVLSQLRKRMNNRYGEASHVPALQLLLLDTDKKSLLEMTHRQGEPGLTSEETMVLQLRRPQEYRAQAKRLLGWLSRRWLYNIPKSLRTEGLRPLGRLAFADHARRAMQRIRLSLVQAMNEQSIATSGEQTGQVFRGEGVRVYVVSSISGGTGSGMSIDLGYAVQGLLEKLGIEQATTTGIFLHSTGRDSRFSDLAKVNAFSWLKEFNHFSRPEGFYPGDEASGLPAMPAGVAAFDHTYFLHLGDGLSAEQLKQNADSVAQYLYLDALTAAQTFFEVNRQAQPTSVAGYPALRTFGLHEESAASKQSLEAVVQQLCSQVVLGWSGAQKLNQLTGHRSEPGGDTASVSETSQIISGAPRAAVQLQLNLEGISAKARMSLEQQFGTSVEKLLERLLLDFGKQSMPAQPAEVLELVDTLFAPAAGAEAALGNYVFGRRVDVIVNSLGIKLASDLQNWLLERLDEGQERFSGAKQAAEWFVKHLQRVEADGQRIAQGLSRQLMELGSLAAQAASGGEAAFACGTHSEVLALAIKYFRLKIDLSALQATSTLVRMLQAELKGVHEAIVEFGRHLRHFSETLTQSVQAADCFSMSSQARAAQDPIGQQLLASLGGLTDHVDRQLQEQFINEQGGLFQTMMGNSKVQADLQAALQSIARQQVNLAARELCASGSQVFDEVSLTQYAQQAHTTLMELGAVASRLVVATAGGDRKEKLVQVREALGEETSLLTGVAGNLVVCNEAGQLPLERVAVDLIECRRDYAEFADRVHTRNDISWTPLVADKAAAVNSEVSFATQVL